MKNWLKTVQAPTFNLFEPWSSRLAKQNQQNKAHKIPLRIPQAPSRKNKKISVCFCFGSFLSSCCLLLLPSTLLKAVLWTRKCSRNLPKKQYYISVLNSSCVWMIKSKTQKQKLLCCSKKNSMKLVNSLKNKK